MKKTSLVGRELKNSKESAWAPGLQLLNASGDVDSSTLGYQYAIQTTSFIRSHVVHQKFYQIAPADYVPIIVGEGAYLEDIKTNLVYDVAGDFTSGIQSVASGPSQVAHVDVGTAPVTAKVFTWAKGYQYSNIELQKALSSNNWDVVSSKLEALKRHWDLGIQKIAFLGLLNDLTNTPGLLTNANVTINTSLITVNISAMSPTQFQALVAGVVKAYVQNCAYTAMPDTFLVPMDDYVGLATPVNPSFPINTMLDYLLMVFKQITGNPNFQIKPLAYGNQAQNLNYINGATGKFRYVLYRKDVDTLALEIPVDFVLNPANTGNNFNWQGVAVGQFTGVAIFRPGEVLYFDHT